MLGYFVGAEIAGSEIGGTFEGDQNGFGVSIGGYGVRALCENLYIDGFLTFGLGQSAIDITDGVLALEGDYGSHSVTLGGALTGVIDRWFLRNSARTFGVFR